MERSTVGALLCVTSPSIFHLSSQLSFGHPLVRDIVRLNDGLTEADLPVNIYSPFRSPAFFSLFCTVFFTVHKKISHRLSRGYLFSKNNRCRLIPAAILFCSVLRATLSKNLAGSEVVALANRDRCCSKRLREGP